MGPFVVASVVVAFALLIAVVLVAVRLVRATRTLGAEVRDVQQRLRPPLDELAESGQVATLEVAQIEERIDALRRVGSGRSADGDRYTAVQERASARGVHSRGL